MWQLQSVLSVPKVLECKGNFLRVFLKAPILTPDCAYFGQMLDCVVDSFVSDHELLIEFDEGSMELKKVQVHLQPYFSHFCRFLYSGEPIDHHFQLPMVDIWCNA